MGTNREGLQLCAVYKSPICKVTLHTRILQVTRQLIQEFLADNPTCLPVNTVYTSEHYTILLIIMFIEVVDAVSSTYVRHSIWINTCHTVYRINYPSSQVLK